MSALTGDLIRSLAPDSAALKAGQQLASAKKWTALGATDTVLWGEIQGSGAKPYQVRVDLRDSASKCSCPSRKLPCKHSLALMLIYTEARKQVPSERRLPEWVADWAEGREKRAKKDSAPPETTSKPRDEEAAAKRAEQRESRVDAGVAELTLWMSDIVRGGLASARELSGSFWDNTAARMINAQASGLARMVVSIQNALFSGEGWEERAGRAVARLHLLLRAYSRFNQLSVSLQAEIRTLVGWTQDRLEVLGSGSLRDQWLVLGQIVDDSDRVRSRRTWLIGENTQQSAMLLDFSVADRPFEPAPPLGSRFGADLCFYAGALRLRALVREQLDSPLQIRNGFPGTTIKEALAVQAGAMANNPWIERWPMALVDVTPRIAAGKYSSWYVQDREGTTLPLRSKFAYLWEIMAISGGGPIGLFGEWDGDSLLPLSVSAAGRFFALMYSAGACVLRRIA